MGRKQQTTKDEEPKEPTPQAEEDSPVVKQLKEIDDKYMALEKEYLMEVYKIRMSFDGKLKSNLEERKAKLRGEDGNEEVATKSLPKFWITALTNHPNLAEMIEEHDAPVLEHLDDITQEFLDSENHRKGMRLHFHFAKNKWFDHSKLSLEIETDSEDLKSMWQNEPCAPVLRIKCDPETIEWKPGQDVTVEKVAKKVKGGGAKKAKQKKEKEEPRPSFFRFLFRTLKKEDELPKDLEMLMKGAMMDPEDDDDDDEEPEAEDYLDMVGQVTSEIADSIVPHAVRWYTGEAAPSDDDMDEDFEEEDDDDFDDEDEDDDDDDDEPPKGGKKGRGRGAPKKKAGKSPKDSPATGPAADPKKEECKQQ